MHADLTKLLDLQAKDSELFHLDDRLRLLDDELAVLETSMGQAREGVAAAQRAIQAESVRRDELEQKIEAHRKHQEKRREKLEFMKTQKEVAGLMAEIDLARGSIVTEEGDWLKSSEQVSQLEMRKVDAEQGVAAMETEQSAARAAIGARRRDLEAERAAAQARRDASAAGVPKPVLQHYLKLRASSTRAEVVVALAGAACGACFTTIPMSRRSLIRGGEAIEGCENCGVILYFAG